MLFPELDATRFALVNLNDEAKEWLKQRSVAEVNPLLDSTVCQTLINDCHWRLGVDFSYGGWLEDRGDLLWGSYLDEERRYIHLGVDFNVPAGTRVTVDTACTVLRIDDDYPEEHGWGTRVIVQESESNAVIIFAHLDRQVSVHIDEVLLSGTTIGSVGISPYNGGWFPHLHVQVVDAQHYSELLNNDLNDLDGYGYIEDIDALKSIFFDPMEYVAI